ncbi:LytTR family DNA-binding domain-containing protein [Winogradskyella sp.]|uniref:LytR/AlgR family response regulator transcription factor n=1 Tax=Winogradskyella sp. TaxID=1883156 RepID=UPI00261E1B7F|nr:LytTR family DNA-binding domain-containing protein [Winogradskyella sp.]
MPYTCIIIEDNEKQNNANKVILEDYVSHIDQAFSLHEAKSKLQESNYDLIIADVQLGDGIVFEALIKPNIKEAKVIFTTSHSKYAVEAFKFSALSYLLKPYTDEDLRQEVVKTLNLIQQHNYHKQLEVFFHNLKSQQETKRIVLKNHDLIHVVNLKDIYYAQADNNYTHFFCEGRKKILVSKSLKTFEVQLNKDNFFRCHHSYLINLNKIKALHKSADAVILSDDSTIPVATRKKNRLQYLLKM